MSSSAGGQEAEAYASRGAEGTTYVPRGRDPPPGYDGESPEVSFKVYEKAVRLWQFETDVPAVKQGAKLLRALSGTAKLAVEDLEFEEITSKDGVKTILARLREFVLFFLRFPWIHLTKCDPCCAVAQVATARRRKGR